EDRFTAADLFVGAMVNVMISSKVLDPRPAFTDFVARVTDRPAYRRAKEIDNALIVEMQPAQ
ncbi:MAG: glutathione S-transferase, partial [Sphingomicrobium sp.]